MSFILIICALFIINIESAPINCLMCSYLAELRHDNSDGKPQSDKFENLATAGFLLSGDTTGVFARCIASVPLS